jgi:hypothetical protein
MPHAFKPGSSGWFLGLPHAVQKGKSHGNQRHTFISLYGEMQMGTGSQTGVAGITDQLPGGYFQARIDLSSIFFQMG